MIISIIQPVAEEWAAIMEPGVTQPWNASWHRRKRLLQSEQDFPPGPSMEARQTPDSASFQQARVKVKRLRRHTARRVCSFRLWIHYSSEKHLIHAAPARRLPVLWKMATVVSGWINKSPMRGSQQNCKIYSRIDGFIMWRFSVSNKLA